ncbi:MAG: thioesterase [Bacilli bacterium]
MSTLVESQEFVVSTTELDRFGLLKMSAILDYFQTTAGIHVTKIKLSREEMLKKNLIWVLVRNKIQIVKPSFDIVKAECTSWPHKANKLTSVRDYELRNEKDELVVKGSSVWALYDIKKNFISRFPENFFVGEFLDKKIFENDLEKLHVYPKSELIFCHNIAVKKSMYDQNMHVNNAVYASFIYDDLSTKDVSIVEIQIDYINQLHVDGEFNLYKKELSENELYYAGFVENKLIFSSIVRYQNEPNN